jgi:hypothetical protein
LAEAAPPPLGQVFIFRLNGSRVQKARPTIIADPVSPVGGWKPTEVDVAWSASSEEKISRTGGVSVDGHRATIIAALPLTRPQATHCHNRQIGDRVLPGFPSREGCVCVCVVGWPETPWTDVPATLSPHYDRPTRVHDWPPPTRFPFAQTLNAPNKPIHPQTDNPPRGQLVADAGTAPANRPTKIKPASMG